MPTPVNAARQCLTEEAAAALDDAVAVASRRWHAQTTSLHMVSSLLSLPDSRLREACTRTRNINAHHTLFQFKALELSLSVSLDRLPSSQAAKVEEPPISNSLMAAIKRSQASQRRHPESFNFYHHQQQQHTTSSSSVAAMKVELRNLIVSILDDPLVSRVFGEVGFRSCDIKLAIFGYSPRYKRPKPSSYLGSKGCTFPFMGCFSGDENCRRIGEVMVRCKKRNPMLLGVSSGDALTTVLGILQRKIEGVLPVGLIGSIVVCVKDEILRFVIGDSDELRFDEVERMLGNVVGNKVVVNLGDLKAFDGDDVAIDGLRYLVGKVSKLLKDHGGKLWLIGAVEKYEVYLKILKKISSIEEEWDLEIVPITSLKSSMGGSYPRSSLMESFVPLGGFFSMPSDTKSSLSSECQYVARYHQYNGKYNQEVTALWNGGLCSSYPEQSGFAATKAKDDRMLLNSKIVEYTCQLGYQFPSVVGFQVAENQKENTSNDSTASTLSKSGEIPLKFVGDLKSHLFDSSSASVNDDHTSPNNSVTSVTTELGLGLVSSSTSREPEKPADESHEDLSTNVDAIKSTISNCPSQSSSCCFLDDNTNSNVKDPKRLYRALLERVDQQEEAIAAVVEAITRCQTKTRGFNGISRGDVWINFEGPDRVGKKRLALALAEILYGSAESFIYINLDFQGEMAVTDIVLKPQLINKYDLTMRGTIVDYLVEKLSKKPCVVYLENVDKSDPVVQTSLSQAVKIGRFTDLHGREVNISNSMFLSTTSFLQDSKSLPPLAKFPEEDVLKAKGHLLQISIGFNLNDEPILMNERKINSTSRIKDRCGSMEVTKRAQKGSNSHLDLNLPPQTSEICNTSSEDSRSWLEDFNQKIDQTVVFKPPDLDALAEKLFKNMNECLHEVVGLKCPLEVESRVMLQLVAAAYFLGKKRVEDWIQHVLRKGFLGAIGKFSLNAYSTVKLVACESTLAEEHTEDNLLPSRITVR